MHQTAILTGILLMIVQSLATQAYASRRSQDGPSISPFLFSCDDEANDPWTHPLLGTFSRNPLKFCSASCNRDLACCRPQQPDKLDVKFILMTFDGREYTGSFDDSSFDEYLSDNDSPIAVFVHGFSNSYLTTSHINDTRRLYVSSGFNFLILDWHIASSVYAQSVYNIRVIGAMLGYFLNRYDLQPDAICIGFSLGAHACGEAGKWLSSRRLPAIAHCHMLDPVSVLFDGCPEDLRQNRHDCDTVSVLHVSQNISNFMASVVLAQSYGSRHASGNCDYWINDGMSWKQPGCQCSRRSPVTTGVSLPLHCIACAHLRVLDYYVSEVRKTCRRVGVESTRCGSVQDCQPVTPRPLLMFLPPYDACNNSLRMDFRIITTQKEPPFC